MGRPRPLHCLFSLFSTIFLKWVISGHFFVYFQPFFKKTIHNFYYLQYNLQKMAFQYLVLCWDLNPQPLDLKSPPITTRPGLPPNINTNLQQRNGASSVQCWDPNSLPFGLESPHSTASQCLIKQVITIQVQSTNLLQMNHTSCYHWWQNKFCIIDPRSPRERILLVNHFLQMPCQAKKEVNFWPRQKKKKKNGFCLSKRNSIITLQVARSQHLFLCSIFRSANKEGNLKVIAKV